MSLKKYLKQIRVGFFILLYIEPFSAYAKSEVLILNDVVKEAISSHPQVLEIQNKAKAAKNVPSRAGSLPDPMLQLTAQNFRTDDFSSDSSPMSALGIGLVQNIPFPGKLARRSRIAKSKSKTISETVRLTKALVIHNLKRAYWHLHFTEKAYEITQENLKIIDVLADVAINRIKVAKVAQQDAFQAQVAHSKLRAEIIQRRESLLNAKRDLNRAIGRNPEEKIGRTQELSTSDLKLASKTLSANMRKESPYLKVADLKVNQSEKILAEAKYDRFPDLKFGVNYKLRDPVLGDQTDGADMVTATIGISIPIWMGRKQNARVSENINKLLASKEQQRDVDLQVGTRLGTLHEKIMRLNGEINLYKKEVLPRANKALDASITDYKRAKVGFVSVVSNWNTELDLQINFEKLLKDRAIAESEIELVTGTSLRRLNL